MPRAPYKPAGRVYINELSAILDRSRHTIRWWEKEGALPKEWASKRDERGWRDWTIDQVDLLVKWIEETRPQSEYKLMTLRAARITARKVEPDPEYFWYIYLPGEGDPANGPFLSGRDAVDTADLIEGEIELRRVRSIESSMRGAV